MVMPPFSNFSIPVSQADHPYCVFLFVNQFLCALAASDKAPLTWQTRIQIAVDIANALVSFL